MPDIKCAIFLSYPDDILFVKGDKQMCNKKQSWKNEESGTMSVEVVIFLTLFIVFFIVIIQFMDFIIVQSKVQSALCCTAKEVSAYSAFTGSYAEGGHLEPNDILLLGEFSGNGSQELYEDGKRITSGIYRGVIDAAMIDQVTKEILTECYPDFDAYLRRHGVIAGLDSIKFFTDVSDDGTMVLTAAYTIHYGRLPFFNEFIYKQSVVVNACTKLWTRAGN